MSDSIKKYCQIVICPKRVIVSNLSREVISLCKFAASGSYGFKGIFDHHLTHRLPQKGSKIAICPK